MTGSSPDWTPNLDGMWFTVLLMALAISTEPFRLGMTVLMLNRPRPVAHLFAFLCGGFIMAIAVGLVVLFVLRTAITKSTGPTLPILQLVIGGAALLIAAFVVSGVKLRRGAPAVEKTPSKWRQRLTGESPLLAGVAGIAIALPSVDYLAVLTVILASGAAASAQIGALLMFNVVAFAFVEVPLAGYLFAPNRTRTVMDRLNQWMTEHRRWTLSAMLVVVGCILLMSGVLGLQ